MLTFDFKSDVRGEIHGIGFDTDDTVSPEWIFKLDGTQWGWGLQAANGEYTTGSGYQSYSIRVGDYFQGDFDRIVFAMDDDAGVGADSSFRNISLQEGLRLMIGTKSTYVASYSVQDGGTAEVSESDSAVTLTENAWKKAMIDTTITADSILTFDFKSDVRGEIHGIGFDTDDIVSPEWMFKLDGTQWGWGLQAANGGYTTGSGYQSYAIRVGDYFQGDFDRIVFAMDDDAGVGADSSFRNIALHEGPWLKIGSKSADVMSFGTQDAGTAKGLVDGSAVTLTNNAWKKIDIDTTITAETVLNFEFKSDVRGEIHGIGFDTDDTASPEWMFKLDGTQWGWGLQAANGEYTTGSGYQSYSIRVGDYFQGDFDRIVFAMDDDARVGADSSFRNISIADEFIF